MPTALLIIDVQQVLSSGEHAAYEVERVIDRINLVSRKVRAADGLVVVIQHETRGGNMDYGSDSWNLAPGLEVGDGDVHVRKTATDSFHRTELHNVLLARGITNLIICGLQSDFCVDTTTRRALALADRAYVMERGRIALSGTGAELLDNRDVAAAYLGTTVS